MKGIESRNFIIAHGDGDGVTSAALALAVLKEAYVYFSHPAGLYDDLRNVIEMSKGKLEKLIICDIALSELHLGEIVKLLESLSKSCEITYIDHHPPPLQLDLKELPGIVVHGEEECTAELTFKHFEDQLDWDMSRVALYGAICDYATETEFFKETLQEWNQRMIFFESGVLAQGLEGSRGQYEFKRHVAKHLSENRLPSSLSELLVKALIATVNEEEMRKQLPQMVKTLGNIAYVIDPPGSVARAANYVRVIAKKPVGLAAEKKGNVMVMSVRTGLKQLDLNTILRNVALKFNGTGGGHRMAAGARVPLSLFDAFLKELNKEISKFVLELSPL